MNSSVLPTFNFLTDERIDYTSIQNEEIISPIRHQVPMEYLAKRYFYVTTRWFYPLK